MKERFSRIFELWNQRNIGFYKECFKKLETENKTSFNYIAGISPVMWMVFRKMYGWATLFTLIFAGINAILSAFFPSATRVTSISRFLIIFVVFGFIGNTLYLKHVKSKVEKGYAEIQDYNSIDPIWSVLYVGLLVFAGSFFMLLIGKGVPLWGVNLIGVVVQLLIISIPWMIDCKKCCSQEIAAPLQVNEESIGKYLEKANSQKMFAAVWVLIACLLITGVSGIVAAKMVGEQIQSRLEKISEDLDKMPNDDKVPDSAATDSKITEQLDKTSEEVEETQDDSELSDISGSVAEIQNDNIDDQLANLADEIDKTLNDSKNSEVSEEIVEAEESDGTLNASENFDVSIQNDQNSDQSFDEDIDQD